MCLSTVEKRSAAGGMAARLTVIRVLLRPDRYTPLPEKKRAANACPFSEASTGFEPVIRVLQTLALPLGHDAIKQLLIVD
jgi:hypothetical protein